MIKSDTIITLDKIISSLNTAGHPLNDMMKEYQFFQQLNGTGHLDASFLIWCQGVSNELLQMRQELSQVANMLVRICEHHQRTFNNNSFQECELSNLRNIQYKHASQQIQIAY
jgi:exonuclease VII small subunit